MAENVFTFRYLSTKAFPALSSTTGAVHDSLLKWSMDKSLQAQAFSYDQPFQPYQANDFALAFMQDPNVISSLQVISDSGRSSTLGIKAESVTVEMVPCSILSMSHFEKLHNDRVVRSETGNIVKCFDEYFDDFTVSDELRKMLLMDDSDNYTLYSEEERSEFLFRLFKHLCLGGAVCQYEDNIQPYLDVTKSIYKDLVSVQKDKNGQLSIISHVLKITASDSKGLLYPAARCHEQNFCYLIIDPIKRHINVLYNKYGASVFG